MKKVNIFNIFSDDYLKRLRGCHNLSAINKLKINNSKFNGNHESNIVFPSTKYSMNDNHR